MSDFKHDVNTNLIIPLGANLYDAIGGKDSITVTYNLSDNRYEYNFGNDKSVKLYSTNDILNYYFEDNLENVLKDGKIYTITLGSDIDIITYEGVVIGLGASNKQAERAFSKLISVGEVVEFLENNPASSGLTGSATTLVTGLEDEGKVIGEFATNLIAYFNSSYHLGNTNTGTGIDSNEYANALAALNGIDSFNLSYPGSFIISKYNDTIIGEADRNILFKFYMTNNDLGNMGYSYGEVFEYNTPVPFSLLQFLKSFGVDSLDSYQDWLKKFDENNDRGDIIYSNAEISIPFDYEKFLDINLSENSASDNVAPAAGVYSSDEIIGIWENTNAIDNFDKKLKKIFKAITDNVNKARKTGYDPLILDLDGDGFNIETKELGANFDLDKNGFAEKINWTSKDGFLCLDLNGNGTIDDGGELFGDKTLLADGTDAKNGFEALAQYDGNGDGIIDENDEIFGSLRVWVDADGNGANGEGELWVSSDLFDTVDKVNLKGSEHIIIYNYMPSFQEALTK